MAKKIVGFIKLQIPAGKANPSPPIGPALGQRGLNIMEFCKAFNAQTQGMEPGLVLPVVITAFADKSFTFVLKTPPATVLLKKGLRNVWMRGTRSSGSSRPRSPRATITASLACTISSSRVMASGRSSLAMSGTSAPPARLISSRACCRTAALCTKLKATQSTPARTPKRRSAMSLSVSLVAGSSTPGTPRSTRTNSGKFRPGRRPRRMATRRPK